MEWLINNKEIIGLMALIIMTIIKYVSDYSDKFDKLFGKMRKQKQTNYEKSVKVALEPVKQELDKKIDELEQTIKLRDQKAIRCEILLLYNTYKDKKEIPAEVFETYCELFDRYKDIQGNHYIDRIDPEIRAWKII